MKNNVIELYPYNRRNASNHRNERICCWLITIADTLTTISIGCCTIFCMYLAYTML